MKTLVDKFSDIHKFDELVANSASFEQYQDEVYGNLFQQIVKLMDLLCTKYIKAIITYAGIQRIETLPMPREVLREWGRGIERIITACKNDGFSTPEFRYDASGIWTTFKFEYPERDK